MRNVPPISTCCPLETITSFPALNSFKAKRTAAALLFTAIPDSAPVNEDNKPVI